MAIVRMVLLQLLRSGKFTECCCATGFWNHKKVQTTSSKKTAHIQKPRSFGVFPSLRSLVQVNGIVAESPSDGGRCC